MIRREGRLKRALESFAESPMKRIRYLNSLHSPYVSEAGGTTSGPLPFKDSLYGA